VSLYKALGGGWTNEQTQGSPVPAKT
jgi:hypothetical protein